MVRDRDDLQSVGKRPELIGRKLDVAGGQRLGRLFVRPVRDLSPCARRLRQDDGGRGDDEDCGANAMRHCGSSLPLPDPFGMRVMTSRFSGVKYFCATRCTSAAVMFWKMSNSPSAVVMSL